MILLNKFFLLLLFIYDLNCLPTKSNDESYITRKEFLELYEKISATLKISEEFIIRFNHADTMKKYMNLSVDPCDNFYEYACGNWETFYPIPKDSNENHIFLTLNTQMQSVLKKSLSESENLSEVEQIAKLFYSSCMDVEKIKETSIEPLLNFINETGGWPVLNNDWSENTFDLLSILVKQQKYGLKSILAIDTDIDIFNATTYISGIEKPQLGLENHADYINEDNKKNLDAYKHLISKILQILNVDIEKSEKIAQEIIDFEIELIAEAGNYTSIEDYFIPITLEKIIEIYPDFDWKKYFNLIYDKEIDSKQKIILNGLTTLKNFMIFLNETNKTILHNYITWQSVYQIIDVLDERFIHEKDLLLKAISGKEEPQRWKKCVEITSKKLGWLTSSMFIRATGFDEATRNDAISVTEEIRNEFLHTLKNFDWIDENTKKSAELKANSIKLLIGYPDFITNENKLKEYYKSLKPIDNEKYFENFLKAVQHDVHKKHEVLNTNVDKEKWIIYAAVADAFYHPIQNRMFFPSGVLQLPLYHKYFPKALKYAGMGSFIGHELTHGFDVSGRLFDYEGNMKIWWSEESIAHFTKKADCFSEQYSNFTIHGKEISGELSNDENIADNGGLHQAFSIYEKWLNKANFDEISKENLPNFNITDKKLFFLGYAQSWCSSIRPEAIQLKLETDVHPPGRIRVLGVLQNSKAFSETFHCPKGSYMNPIDKCRLW